MAHYYSSYKKFHLLVGKGTTARRTTISVESYLADSLAIKLGRIPNTPEAHSAVRKWLQEQQTKEGINYEPFLVKRALVLEVMDKTIVQNWPSLAASLESLEETPSHQDLLQ